jgi:hypothetical protein
MEDTEEKKEEPKIDPEKQKRMERQSITLLVILVLFLAFFVTAYFMLKPKPYFEYNNLKIFPISLEGSSLIFYSIPVSIDIGKGPVEQNIVLRNDPRQIENLSYNVSMNLFKIAAIGFTMEPTLSANAVIAAEEIANLGKTLQLPIAFGVIRDFEGKTENIFDCENATNLSRVIRMDLGNETKVYGKDNCIIISGENYDGMIKAADKLTIEWLKLITKNEAS